MKKKIHKNREKKPCVYMLLCADNSLYTGWTNDLESRVRAHSSGKGAKYTRSRLPVAPVYAEYFDDKSSAVKREAAIKKLSAEKKRELISSGLNMLKRYGAESSED
ncbi:MAG TPA: GIY-YIG nuclease family protein [Candidatus Copromorpha excrementigallinarum]|uniref:GIY-YIG nuclease family protein n=1 Tax=Candidatus Allocopromorpha excrementigallinarum TaxID=2840742 RepID=A0A9D1HZ14_9FIRM|nr:GIY-YIG nuclease family protein [Candidatus Copromorpha excrementigallinarum]